MTEDRSDPSGAAAPIGARVAGNNTDASHAPGILMSRMDAIFEMNE